MFYSNRMYFFKKIVVFFLITEVYSLSPKKLPNGKSKKFEPNKKQPRSDLKLENEYSASLITKNWMDNILLHLVNNKKKYKNNILEYDDLHIVTNINSMKTDNEDCAKNNKNISTLYFSWNPKCVQGLEEPLFIVVAKLDKKYKILNIENIVQSPFWDNEQIESIYLKYSLIDQNNSLNLTNISFSKLYEKNIRFQLSWENWYNF